MSIVSSFEHGLSLLACMYLYIHIYIYVYIYRHINIICETYTYSTFQKLYHMRVSHMPGPASREPSRRDRPLLRKSSRHIATALCSSVYSAFDIYEGRAWTFLPSASQVSSPFAKDPTHYHYSTWSPWLPGLRGNDRSMGFKPLQCVHCFWSLPMST